MKSSTCLNSRSTIFLMSLLIVYEGYGQGQECKVQYKYDLTGNRTERSWYCHTPGESETKQSGILENVSMGVRPNPATEELTISIPEEFASGNIDLVAGNGSILQSTRVTSQLTVFNVSELPVGQYFVRFMHDDETLINSFIKE